MTSRGQDPPTLQLSDNTAFRQLLEVETHKSLHICTDKGDWMLYPWLPSHVICIIFITKAFSVFSLEPPANMMYTDQVPICEGTKSKKAQ